MRDAAGQIALQGENVATIALEYIGPDMLVIGGTDQLCGDAHAIICLKYSALHYGVNVQALGNLRESEMRSFVLHGRCAGDDTNAAKFRQISDQCLCHAVGEVIVPDVAREIL